MSATARSAALLLVTESRSAWISRARPARRGHAFWMLQSRRSAYIFRLEFTCRVTVGGSAAAAAAAAALSPGLALLSLSLSAGSTTRPESSEIMPHRSGPSALSCSRASYVSEESSGVTQSTERSSRMHVSISPLAAALTTLPPPAAAPAAPAAATEPAADRAPAPPAAAVAAADAPPPRTRTFVRVSAIAVARLKPGDLELAPPAPAAPPAAPAPPIPPPPPPPPLPAAPPGPPTDSAESIDRAPPAMAAAPSASRRCRSSCSTTAPDSAPFARMQPKGP